ncbi:MAG: aldehyde ferredoxin oxidoreductase family protein [Thermodesulfobacteriota bacterium]|jgi:aldehyde:ferredoxin oxidoreductase
MFGYNGRFLRVNLSEEKVTVEEPAEDYYKRYLGGRGFIATALLQEMPGGVDPLGPENRLIFALGPITGMPIPGSGRNSVGAKSPLTGGFGEAEAGGFFGAELKKAGFDAAIIEGAAKTPVYLWIKDGTAELRDARGLWGLETRETQLEIRKDLQDPLIRTAAIGPGGENLVRFACILNDLTHAAGRTGLGAVMGSKKLKAIAVRGKAVPPMANEKVVRDLTRWMAQNFKKETGFWKAGTGQAMEAFSLAGVTPTSNFKEGCFDAVKKITAQAVLEQFGVGMEGCYACPVRCKKKVRIDDPTCSVDPAYGGPEYETLGAFGSNCGIDDAKAICKAHEICNRQGVDTISAGVTLSFAMECFENGLLTLKDTDGIELRFGNAGAMLQMLERTVRRQGLGALLAEGTRIAARQIGRGAIDLAMQVKGLEIPMHDPRSKQGMALHYSVNPAGADHCTGVHDPAVEKGPGFEDWGTIDVNESIPTTELSPRKTRMVFQVGLWCQLPNYLGFCLFVPFKKKQLQEAAEAITGWPMSYWRLMKTVERGLTLAKIFNLREGFTKAEDGLPKRMAISQTNGNLKGVIVDPQKLAEAQELYYQMLGWDSEGVPTRGRLVELGIEWASRYLKGR